MIKNTDKNVAYINMYVNIESSEFVSLNTLPISKKRNPKENNTEASPYTIRKPISIFFAKDDF
jgi:hypothetical protein